MELALPSWVGRRFLAYWDLFRWARAYNLPAPAPPPYLQAPGLPLSASQTPAVKAQEYHEHNVTVSIAYGLYRLTNDAPS